MAVVIVAVGSAVELWPRPRYLKSYDPDFVPMDRTRRIIGQTGLAAFTDDVREAMRFPDVKAAMACWNQQSTVIPTRPDGRPNKPLTAYTISFETVPDA